MPNWVYNTISSPSLHTLDVFTKNKEGDYFLDFEKIIPFPTRETCPEKYLLDTPEKVKNTHIEPLDGMEWFDWYHWSCDFWGTKWNSITYNKKEPLKEDKEFDFQTAWSCPTPILEKLSKMLPKDEELKLVMESEYDNNRHTVIYKNGDIISEEIEELPDEDDYEDSDTEE